MSPTPILKHDDDRSNTLASKTEKATKEGSVVTHSSMKRRSFLKAAGALGAATGATALASNTLLSAEAEGAEDAPAEERVTWSHCSVNCYGRCAIRLHSRNDEIFLVESDSTGRDELGDHQLRACLRGRSIRRWINHPERILHPLKRVGARGSGEFERISWDEAIELIASNYRRILQEYGAEAVHITNATGVKAANISQFLKRFANLNGGFLVSDGGYSAAQAKTALPYVYGKMSGNDASDIANSKLVVFFGDNPADNRIGGAGNCFQLRKAIEKGGAEVVVIDPRFSTTAATFADEWIPIRPGTDAALVDAMAYTLISEDLVDQDFLDRYCVGYDEDTMPEGAPANASYKSYILGLGADSIPKTPEWASSITGIDGGKIAELARRIAEAKPCAIVQGLGPQRHENGEQTTRAICMLPILTGNVGIKGGGTGSTFGSFSIKGFKIPEGDNGVKVKIPTFKWIDGVSRGKELTAIEDGIKGADALPQPIKFVWNYAGNSLTNQHGNINYCHQVLADESLCEFIVVWETMMTDSAKYADVILPDLMPAEQPSFVYGENSGNMAYFIMGQPATNPKGECKSLYESLALLAEKMGCREEFTEGRDEKEWLEYAYNEARKSDEDLPSFEEMWERGIYRRENPKGSTVAFSAFREDPEANPLETPSGKIEVYSSDLAAVAERFILPKGDTITPIHVYAPAVEGWDDELRGKYPLQMIGFHTRGHCHSSYTQVDVLSQANRHQLWLNPADAVARSIADGDQVRVFNDRGAIQVEVKVTDKILEGVTALPQGAWYELGRDGVDVGGCINTLTSSHPSPLAKATSAHTCLVEVRRAD